MTQAQTMQAPAPTPRSTSTSTQMPYVDDYRARAAVDATAQAIARAVPADFSAERPLVLMDFCGGHTHAIARFGLEDLLPPSVRLVHGPGCPVCVLPTGRIDSAIDLARQHDLILCSYGDMLRVPGSAGSRANDRDSLLKAKADGADVRMVYSPLDVLALARRVPHRTVVFFAVGFETTTPPTALALLQARAEGLSNLSVFCNHVLTPPAIDAILQPDADGTTVELHGIIGPGHVSVITGSDAYRPYAERYQLPIVISGFEPLDLMQSILMLVRQRRDGRAEVETQYSRAIASAGNRKAQQAMSDVFTQRPSFDWRGLGSLPNSALTLRPDFAEFDAEQKFSVPLRRVPDHPACACAQIIRGRAMPTDCPIFATACRPDHPVGSCMVSSEGACAAAYVYGRHREKTTAHQRVEPQMLHQTGE